MFYLQPVVFPTARQSGDFLRSNPKARAADIHAAFRDPGVWAVFDLDFGHTNPTVPIPIGGDVELDPRTETIRFS